MKLGLVGAGRWGKNLIRNFFQLGVLSVVCDSSDASLERIGKEFPTVRLTKDFQTVLNDDSIQAIVIATPTCTHEVFAKRALNAGKHVYVEKPLARSSEGAQDLIKLSEKLGLTLMVGHLLLYHPAVNKLKELIADDYLGEIRFLNSDRRNFSMVRGDTNVMWDLAPHDISMISYILNEDKMSLLEAKGFSTEGDGVIDVAHLDLKFGDNIFAHIHNSWIDPQKQCLLTVNGKKKTAVLNDAKQEDKLVLYSMLSDGRIQEEHPVYANNEPLRLECEHFINCISSGEKPLSDGVGGYKVVNLLEVAEDKMS